MVVALERLESSETELTRSVGGAGRFGVARRRVGRRPVVGDVGRRRARERDARVVRVDERLGAGAERARAVGVVHEQVDVVVRVVAVRAVVAVALARRAAARRSRRVVATVVVAAHSPADGEKSKCAFTSIAFRSDLSTSAQKHSGIRYERTRGLRSASAGPFKRGRNDAGLCKLSCTK